MSNLEMRRFGPVREKTLAEGIPPLPRVCPDRLLPPA
jgi:hypothetical protein